jgi:hypothetical protein
VCTQHSARLWSRAYQTFKQQHIAQTCQHKGIKAACAALTCSLDVFDVMAVLCAGALAGASLSLILSVTPALTPQQRSAS